MKFILNFLTFLLFLGILLLIAWGVYVYIDPLNPYNIFPPLALIDVLKFMM